MLPAACDFYQNCHNYFIQQAEHLSAELSFQLCFHLLLSLTDVIGQYRALFLFPYFSWAQLHQKVHKLLICSQYSPCTVWHFFCYHHLPLIRTALLAASDRGTPTAHSWISWHGRTGGHSLPAQCWCCCCYGYLCAQLHTVAVLVNTSLVSSRACFPIVVEHHSFHAS